MISKSVENQSTLSALSCDRLSHHDEARPINLATIRGRLAHEKRFSRLKQAVKPTVNLSQA